MKNALRYPHLLQGAPVLHGLPTEFREWFLNACVARSFQSGEPALMQGKAVNGLLLIASGAVEVTSVNQDGQSVLAHVYVQGDVFGEVETICQQSAAAQCVAANDVVALVASHDVLLEAITSPIFLRNIFQATYERLLRDNALKFVDQHFPLDQRLCDYLFRLSSDRDEVKKTQSDLAALLGCARQTLNRELGRLKEKRIIELRKGAVMILNRAALRELGQPQALGG